MSKCKDNPCMSCPYRRDVPSGVWHESEYDKLPPYDNITPEQPVGTFQCHTNPNYICTGWFAVSLQADRGHELLSLRFDPHDSPIPQQVKDDLDRGFYFSTHTEAANHGIEDIESPSDEAVAHVSKLACIVANRNDPPDPQPKHDWNTEPPYQWSQVRGGRPGDALTVWYCTKCGARFAHRYNRQPDLTQAMKDNGIDPDYCEVEIHV